MRTGRAIVPPPISRTIDVANSAAARRDHLQTDPWALGYGNAVWELVNSTRGRPRAPDAVPRGPGPWSCSSPLPGLRFRLPKRAGTVGSGRTAQSPLSTRGHWPGAPRPGAPEVGSGAHQMGHRTPPSATRPGRRAGCITALARLGRSPCWHSGGSGSEDGMRDRTEPSGHARARGVGCASFSSASGPVIEADRSEVAGGPARGASRM